MNYFYSKHSLKFLKKQSIETSKRIIEAIHKLPQGDVKKFQGSGINNLFRLRVGSFRIKFTLDGDNIYIDEINNRGDIY